MKLGLTSDDVIAVQLPNWSEFAIAINAAMLVGIPFCQFHSDFRHREVEFVLRFTGASTVIIPKEFRRFDHVAMIEELRPKLPNLKRVLVVGEDFRQTISMYGASSTVARARSTRRRCMIAVRRRMLCSAQHSRPELPAIRRPCCTSTTHQTTCAGY